MNASKLAGAAVVAAGLVLGGCEGGPGDVDNTARNVRDRAEDAVTPMDQSESEEDRTITARVRQALTQDDTLSTNAQNVKVVTRDGVVTLRGPVESQQERTAVASKARQVAGVKRVDDQLEVAGGGGGGTGGPQPGAGPGQGG